MATPTPEEVLLGGDSGTTVTLTTGAGTAVDDVLIGVQQSDFYDVADMSPPTPGTWTEITTADLGVDSHHLRAWWRPVTSAGENGVTFHPINDEDVGAYLYRLRGAHTSDPVDDAAADAVATASTSHVAPAVAPATADALLICAWGTGNGEYTAVPGSMTQRSFVDGSPFFEMTAADEVLETSGSTGTRTATFDASRAWVALSIAVKGASATGRSGSVASTAPAGQAAAAAGVLVGGSAAATTAAGVAAAAGATVITGSVASAAPAGQAAAAGAVAVAGAAAAPAPAGLAGGAAAVRVSGSVASTAPAGVAGGSAGEQAEPGVLVATAPAAALEATSVSSALAASAPTATLRSS